MQESLYQQMYDQRLVQFTSTPELPSSPQPLLLKHFRQVVLANMKDTGKVQIYDIDPSEDSQIMSVFEVDEGKEYLESFMEDKLLDHENRNRNEVEA